MILFFPKIKEHSRIVGKDIKECPNCGPCATNFYFSNTVRPHKSPKLMRR